MDPLNHPADPTPKLTDDAVSRLPLHAARAELLEEIVSTDVTERTPARPAPASTSRRWLVPLAAAAVVLGVVGGASLWAGGVGQQTSQPATSSAGGSDVAPTTDAPLAEETADYPVIDAPGWVATHVSAEDSGSEVRYEKGRAELEINRYPAATHASYVEDREHIVDPPAPGEPVEVLGRAGQMWAYSPNDRTVITDVVDGSWFELRGSLMTLAELRTVLESIRLADREDFEASLPDPFVTDAERGGAVKEMLQGIEDATSVPFPGGALPGFGAGQLKDQDPYALGVDVAGTYACAWFEELEAATAAVDDARTAEAERVLGTSHNWPVLQDLDETGDYPEMVWQLADEAAQGRLPEWWRDGLGCR